MRRIISSIYLSLTSWRIVGQLPKDKKYILIVAPHTSNWDFVLGKCFAYQFQIKAKFFGKSQLFKPPFGWLFRLMGGIAVERSKNNNLVNFAIEYFNNSDEFILGLAPEGTRSKAEKWKLGFYHIAQGANIPIVVSYLDYNKKEAGVGMILWPSGESTSDLKKIEDFYQTITPKYPQNYNPKII